SPWAWTNSSSPPGPTSSPPCARSPPEHAHPAHAHPLTGPAAPGGRPHPPRLTSITPTPGAAVRRHHQKAVMTTLDYTPQVTARPDGRTDRSTAPVPPEAPDAKTINRAVTASAVGNATEWFDYGVYAVSIVYLTQNFFPGEAGTLLALSTFALSFLVRPLGGLFWGPLGDRFGRKRVLALTIILMAGATFCIGLLPTFSTIGIVAPILLVLLRMVQGFSTGGEYGGAATFMAEYAPDRKRGFFGSFLEFGTLGGFALGTAAMLLLQLGLGGEAMMAYGWRSPCLLGLPM